MVPATKIYELAVADAITPIGNIINILVLSRLEMKRRPLLARVSQTGGLSKAPPALNRRHTWNNGLQDQDMRDRYFTKTIMNASAQYKLHVSVPWFTPLERPFKFIIVGLLLIGLAMAGNNWVRHLQLASWQQATEQTHIGQAPLF